MILKIGVPLLTIGFPIIQTPSKLDDNLGSSIRRTPQMVGLCAYVYVYIYIWVGKVENMALRGAPKALRTLYIYT